MNSWPQAWIHIPINGGDEETDIWPYVAPGDRIITRCTYNTTGKTAPTRFLITFHHLPQALDLSATVA